MSTTYNNGSGELSLNEQRGLSPMTEQSRLGIPLEELRALMREFIAEVADSNTSEMQMQWTLETFLQWLRRRQQMDDDETNARR